MWGVDCVVSITSSLAGWGTKSIYIEGFQLNVDLIDLNIQPLVLDCTTFTLLNWNIAHNVFQERRHHWCK